MLLNCDIYEATVLDIYCTHKTWIQETDTRFTFKITLKTLYLGLGQVTLKPPLVSLPEAADDALSVSSSLTMFYTALCI